VSLARSWRSLSADVVFLQLVEQGAHADAEEPCGQGAVALCAGERLLDRATGRLAVVTGRADAVVTIACDGSIVSLELKGHLAVAGLPVPSSEAVVISKTGIAIAE
jgi:hypothetical protein